MKHNLRSPRMGTRPKLKVSCIGMMMDVVDAYAPDDAAAPSRGFFALGTSTGSWGSRIIRMI